MNSTNNIADAGLYTDFSGLAKLRAKAAEQSTSGQSTEVTKEVAKQFEALFLQMMLKTMRDATITDESTESDQAKFYQEMFDKQIALDLSNSGNGIGIAKMLYQQLSTRVADNQNVPAADFQASGMIQTTLSNETDNTLIRQQIERSTSSILNKPGLEQEVMK